MDYLGLSTGSLGTKKDAVGGRPHVTHTLLVFSIYNAYTEAPGHAVGQHPQKYSEVYAVVEERDYGLSSPTS